MIQQMYKECFSKNYMSEGLPNSLIQNFALKNELQIVYKENKAWLFDYENSVLYTLTQIGALFIYAYTNGHSYQEIITAISKHFNVPVNKVDSDMQSFLSWMLIKDLIKLNS